MSDDPFSNGPIGDGRDSRGRFAKGCVGGPGNPGAKHAIELRQRLNAALEAEVTADRLRVVIRVLIQLAEGGDIAAMKLLLDRIAPPDSEMRERIAALEQLLESDDEQ